MFKISRVPGVYARKYYVNSAITGQIIWGSGVVLAQYMQTIKDNLVGKQILELGTKIWLESSSFLICYRFWHWTLWISLLPLRSNGNLQRF